jgi:hypothetical protein
MTIAWLAENYPRCRYGANPNIKETLNKCHFEPEREIHCIDY